MKKTFNRKLSVAPMMDCTDRHFRYLARLIHPSILLYSEMVTADAVVFGDRNHLLQFNVEEFPVALQLGGSDPAKLKQAAKIGEEFGYDEINLNVGCPSDRVQAGRFGACLMKEPALVAECVAAMTSDVKIPVTVKTRIGVDDLDSYELLCKFIETVAKTGCNSFTIHARKAWLNGLSPRENREIPPLQYETVYQLKRDFPHLEILLNGGVKTADEVAHHLQQVDGVMVGRAAYSAPMILREMAQAANLCDESDLSVPEILEVYKGYIERELQKGMRLRALLRPLIGLYHGKPNGRVWRRFLAENGGNEARGYRVVEDALALTDHHSRVGTRE